MKHFFTLLFLFIYCLQLSAQVNKIWYFGTGAGIDFNSGSAVAISAPTTVVNNYEATGTACDPSGNLMFYTNGVNIYDKNLNLMPNGNSTLGGMSSSTTVCIMPKPQDCGKYYVFTTQDHTSANSNFYYNVIDMCLNNGLGDVVIGQNSVLLHSNVSEKIVVVPNTNGTDFWLITHELSNNNFVVFQITPAGINMIPQIYGVGDNFGATDQSGYIKASANGTKLAMATLWGDIMQVVTFNPTTGVVSGPFTDFGPTIPGFVWYGVEFSPNGNLLYAAQAGFSGSTATLYQFDLVASITTTLFSTNAYTTNYLLDAIQLAPDGKIYVSHNPLSYLGVIDNPDISGVGCNYTDVGFNLLAGTNCQAGLPITNYAAPAVQNINVNLGNDTTSCNISSFTLNAPTGCYSYLWQDGSTQSTFNVTQAGTYWVTVNSSCGSGTDTINVFAGQASSSSQNFSICQGDSLVIGTSVYTLAGSYTDTLISASGCDSILTTNLSVNALPVVNAFNSDSICVGDQVALNATGALNYVWAPATGLSCTNCASPTASPIITTTYIVNGTDANGCSDTDSVFIVVVLSPIINASSGDTICVGDSLQLSVSGSSSYSWTPSVGLSCDTCSNPFASPSVTTQYFVSSINALGCTATDSVVVVVVPAVVAASVGDTILCSGQSVQLNASGGTSYSWSPSTGLSCTDCANPIANPAVTTTYFVTISNGFCDDTASVNVGVTDPFSFDAFYDTLIYQGGTATLGSTGSDSVIWIPANGLSCDHCINPFASPFVTTLYTANGRVNGCHEVDSVLVRVILPCSDVMIPNAFSPNGDDLNDVFKIVYTVQPKLEMFEVFNRWGQMMFATNDINAGWNGIYNGFEEEVGVYVYYFIFDCDGQQIQRKGNVTLVR